MRRVKKNKTMLGGKGKKKSGEKKENRFKAKTTKSAVCSVVMIFHLFLSLALWLRGVKMLSA